MACCCVNCEDEGPAGCPRWCILRVQDGSDLQRANKSSVLDVSLDEDSIHEDEQRMRTLPDPGLCLFLGGGYVTDNHTEPKGDPRTFASLHSGLTWVAE